MVSHPTKEIRCRRIGEACVRIDHPSGLPIFLCPKPGYRSSYAVFATRYGSLDTTCRDAQGKVVPVPEGIAHYLEHKLFENEDCDSSATQQPEHRPTPIPALTTPPTCSPVPAG